MGKDPTTSDNYDIIKKYSEFIKQSYTDNENNYRKHIFIFYT